ncbi:hypothetical protein LPJ61_000348 [Coemansia biformis]|uniref:UBX domain-containing protein n=1 Tax=Coemansia biformis TaxID=1286918 RepID=A0A9W8CZ39_9FUNG|nr:hypothetical protein LPJ61_000348 [Coemansia biformis]
MPAFTVVPASGRPVTVRPQPSDALQSVVAAACAQIPNAGDPEKYALLYNGKPLALSLAVRLANLPQGAKLTLQPAASMKAAAGQKTQAVSGAALVKVALQIVGAGRIIDDFAPSTTLWEVLVKAETRSNGTLNLTARYGSAGMPPPPERPRGGMSGFAIDLVAAAMGGSRGSSPAGRSPGPATPTLGSPAPAENCVAYQLPVLVLLNKEFAGAGPLQATTLRSLGLAGGNVVARLSFKDTLVDAAEAVPARAPALATGTPTEATESPTLPQHGAAAEARSSGAAEQQSATLGPRAAPEPQTAAPGPLEAASEPPAAADSRTGDVSELEARQIRVFDAPPPRAAVSSSSHCAHPEPRHEVDSDEAKILVAVQKARHAAAERGFKSRADQEAAAHKQREQFQQQHPTTAIRFRFPDRVQIQATFSSSDSVAGLFAFVEGALADPRTLGGLVLHPPGQDLAELKPRTLLAARLTPAAVVHVRLVSEAGARPSTLALLRPGVSALSEPLELPPVPAEPPSDARPPPAPLAPAPELPTAPAATASSSSSKTPEATTSAPDQNKRPDGPQMPKWFIAGQRRQ